LIEGKKKKQNYIFSSLPKKKKNLLSTTSSLTLPFQKISLFRLKVIVKLHERQEKLIEVDLRGVGKGERREATRKKKKLAKKKNNYSFH